MFQRFCSSRVFSQPACVVGAVRLHRGLCNLAPRLRQHRLRRQSFPLRNPHLTVESRATDSPPSGRNLQMHKRHQSRWALFTLGALLFVSPAVATRHSGSSHHASGSHRSGSSHSSRIRGSHGSGSSRSHSSSRIRGSSHTHGNIHRSAAAKDEFIRQHPCPSGQTHGCKGYVVDHVKPLACGGADAPFNMQWQTTADAKAKDKWERNGCR
jgi:hypothetical protein